MPPQPAPRPRFAWRRALPLAFLVAALAAFIAAGGLRYLSVAALAAHRADLAALVARWGALAPVVYVAVYALLTALSVPGAAVLTIAGGFLFGTWLGALCAVVGATLGATAVFAAARAGFAGLARRAGPLAQRLEARFRADAFSYLLVLRLVPLFPFWLVNLVPAVLGVDLRTYVAATLLGVVPAGLVYAGLGSGLGGLLAEGRSPDLAAVFRPPVLVPLLALALLSLLPLAYRRWRLSRGPP